MKKTIILIICLVITVIYPETGSLIASSYCSLYGIGWLYVHHTVQMLLALATIFLFVYLFKQKPLSKWGFNLNNYKWSLSTVLKFAAGWIIITIIANLGLFYAIMREKSGSLLGPVLAHGVSDGTITVVKLLLV